MKPGAGEDPLRTVPLSMLEEQAVEGRLLAYQRLAELSLQLAAARDIDAVFRALREFVHKETPMSGIFVSSYDPRERLRTCIYAHSEGEDLDVRALPRMPQTSSPHSRAVTTGEIVITDDFDAATQGQPRVDVGLERDPRLPQSSIVVPMVARDEVIGAVEIQSTRSGVFTSDHVIVLRMAAHLVALALENVWAQEAQARAKAALEQKAEELEEKVQERTRELAEKNRELESFSWTVAHDLRAPLRALLHLSEVLEEDHAADLDEEARAHLRSIAAVSRRMSGLVGSLLEFAKAAQGGVHREPIDLGTIAHEILLELRRDDPAREAQIVVHDDLIVEADPTLVRVLLDNLLGNAWKYSANKDRTVIEVGARVNEGQREFFVRDEGVGFDPREATRLFSAFQRLHPSSEYEGTGIGLATARRIVERHGGRIRAEAEPGKGATFSFTLAPSAKP